MDEVDVFFFGGGQDREQSLVYEDLLEFKQPPLERAVNSGAGVLAVCGGYHLLGPYYQTAEVDRFPGIGMIDLQSEAQKKRFIGDFVVSAQIDNPHTPTTTGRNSSFPPHPAILPPPSRDGGVVSDARVVSARQQTAPQHVAGLPHRILLTPADPQHASAQRKLAGHGHVLEHRPPRQ